jgi:hypothetical protein
MPISAIDINPEVETLFQQRSFNQQAKELINNAANKTLSNLTSPTSINQDLIPSVNLTKNLGSNSFFWNGYIHVLNFSSTGKVLKGASTDFEIDWEFDAAILPVGQKGGVRFRRLNQTGFGFRNTATTVVMSYYPTFIISSSLDYSGIGETTGTNILGFNSTSDVNIVAGRKVNFGSAVASSSSSSGLYNFLTGSSSDISGYLLVRCSTSVNYQGGILIGSRDNATSGNSSYKLTVFNSQSANPRFCLGSVDNLTTEVWLAKALETLGTNGRDLVIGDFNNVGNLAFWGDRNDVNLFSGRGNIYIKFNTTSPIANPVGGGFIYNESGKIKIRDDSGYITTLN